MKKLLVILSVFLMLSAIGMFLNKDFGYGIAFAALAVLLFWLSRKKRKDKQTPQPVPEPVPQPSPSPTPQPAEGIINFRIAGTSFGGRQGLLQKIDESQDDKYLFCSYDIEQREYKGEPAFCIVAELADDDFTRKDLGFVPAALVPQVQAVFDRIKKVEVEIYGGGEDKNYGAAATIKYTV